jgi:hypothetical protein
MEDHVLRTLVLILVFFSYFAWRLNMTGFDNPVVYPFVLAAVFAPGMIIKKYCMEPHDNKKRKQNRLVFIMILVLFMVSVLIRIFFLN